MILDEVPGCAKQGCPKRAITASKYCGEHTDNDKWLATASDCSWFKDDLATGALVSEIETELHAKSNSIRGAEVNDCKFQNSSFDGVRFEHCHFIDVEVTNTSFIGCVFDNCSFNQIYFLESKFYACHFEGNTFEHCQISDGCELDHSKFAMNNFSNTDFVDVASAVNAKFLDCIFTISSFNNSMLQGVKFDGVEFIKTALSFCDFRGSVFGIIHHDFQEVGLAPIGCNFFGCEMQGDFDKVLESHFNNVNQEDPGEFIRVTIGTLVNLKHPNFLAELNQFIVEFEQYGSVIEFKSMVNNHYRELFQIAKDIVNIHMIGGIINNYAHLPEEIRQSANQLIANAGYRPKSPDHATLEITFEPGGAMSLIALNSLNYLLEKVLKKISPDADLEVVSMRRGSLLQIFMGNLEVIASVGGAIALFTGATLKFIKDGVAIKKDRVTIKKSELEIKILEHELATLDDESRQSPLSKEQYIEYFESIETSETIVEEISTTLTVLENDPEVEELVKELDRRFNATKVKIEVQ